MTTQFKFTGMGSNRRFVTGRVSKALLAAAIIAVAAPAAAGDVARSTPGCTTPEPVAGQFTGKFVNGAPVYRLSSITVTANRTAVLPAAARQEQVTRAGQVRTRSAARPPA